MSDTMNAPTILIAAVVGAELDLLSRAAAAAGASLEPVERGKLAARIAAIAPGGPTIVVVATDGDASVALRSGADEMLRAGEISLDAVVRTIERARLRYAARASQSADAFVGADLLTSVVMAELDGPLTTAVLDVEVLWDSLGRALYATERLADWGTLSAPMEQLRSLVALRATAPPRGELEARAESAKQALARAGNVMRVVRELTTDAEPGTTPVSDIARNIVDLLRPKLESVATLAVEIESGCRSPAARTGVVQLVTGLLATAAAACANAAGAMLRVRLFRVDGAVVLEVQHPAGAHPGTGAPRLARLAQIAAEGGADLLVDEDDAIVIARVIFPTATDRIDVPAITARAAAKLLS